MNIKINHYFIYNCRLNWKVALYLTERKMAFKALLIHLAFWSFISWAHFSPVFSLFTVSLLLQENSDNFLTANAHWFCGSPLHKICYRICFSGMVPAELNVCSSILIQCINAIWRVLIFKTTQCSADTINLHNHMDHERTTANKPSWTLPTLPNSARTLLLLQVMWFDKKVFSWDNLMCSVRLKHYYTHMLIPPTTDDFLLE